MKRILLISLLAAGTVFAGNKKTKDPMNSIKGFYVGAGLQYSRSTSKIKATDGTSSFGNPMIINENISNKKIGKLGGTFVFGYGRCLNNFYFGGEGLLDIANHAACNANYTTSGFTTSYYSKVNGIVPSIVARIGWLFPSIGGLAYAKLGLAYVRSEFQEKSTLVDQSIRKMNKIVPLIGIGFEKSVSRRVGVRGEFRYRLSYKGTSQTTLPYNISKFNVENRISGFTFRIIATYRLL